VNRGNSNANLIHATPCRAGQCEENKQNRKKIKKKVDIPNRLWFLGNSNSNTEAAI